VETQISKRIEEAVNTISGIDDLRSTSAEGVSIVAVQFMLDKDPDVAALGRFALEQGKIGAVTSVTPAGRFGNIESTDGTVTAFNEKPDAGGGSINGGFFVFRREFFEVLDRYGDVMLEREPMDELVARGELSAYRHEGFWEPMDTMREYRLLNQLWQQEEARWKVW